jgi:hypothetical protein
MLLEEVRRRFPPLCDPTLVQLIVLYVISMTLLLVHIVLQYYVLKLEQFQ